MADDLLQRIQRLQFTDRPAAEAMLLQFINRTFPFEVTACELRPQVISLNSFNGFITLADGTRRFFKTHTEEDTVIDEYYNAQMLADAGYPIIQPIHSSHETGQQILIYEVIEDPSVFDVAWALENGSTDYDAAALEQAQNDADDDLLQRYLETLEPQSAEGAAEAPIHQLFYHRLVGGRLRRFYGSVFPGEHDEDKYIALPLGDVPLVTARAVRWSINGQSYDENLNEVIERAVSLLRPAQAGPSVIGHGDAHNGNVFFQCRPEGESSLLYFDPAFAGRHDPLLDLVKPLFHNVFAMWMYFPQEISQRSIIRYAMDKDIWLVDYDYDVPPIRQMFLRSKVERVLIPLIGMLKERNLLRPDWRPFLKSALFCCPFLTLDLTDTERFPPEISLLGLAMAVEMGSESINSRSVIDTVLDGVERVL
ncbi:MAG: phosphotransferase [Chloroflexota bacterium]